MKEQFIQELSQYSFLTKDEKDQMVTVIHNIHSLEELRQLQDTIQELNQHRLKKGRQYLINCISEENVLTPGIKTYFLTQTQKAQTKQELESIHKSIQRIMIKHEESLKVFKSYIKEWIQENTFLTKEEKNQAIHTLTILETEKSIYYFAKTLHKEVLQKRTKLIQLVELEIYDLPSLSQEEKIQYIEWLRERKNKREIEELLSQAKDMNRYHEATQFNQKQQKLKYQIHKLPKNIKDQWMPKIVNAKYLGELDWIEEQISEIIKSYSFDKEKETIQEILSHYQLTKKQHQQFSKEIDNANIEQELHQILQKAKEYHNKNIQIIFHKEKRYAKLYNNNCILWNDIYLEEKKDASIQDFSKLLKTKGYYVINGEKYYSLYTNRNQWIGYAKESDLKLYNHPWEVKQEKSFLIHFNDKKQIVWKNLYFKKQKKLVLKENSYVVKRTYYHFNRNIYYSIYKQNTNQWIGYINKNQDIKE